MKPLLHTDHYLLSPPSPGHGSLCCHDSLCPPAQPQGLLPASLRASNLRCLLGKYVSQKPLLSFMLFAVFTPENC